MKRIRIFVVDDEPRVRGAMLRYLAESDEFDVVGEASNGLEALDKFSRVSTDIVLLDISMPDMNGFEVAKRMLEVMPETRIILVSSSWSSRHESAVRRFGVLDFVPKEKMLTDLAPTIRRVAAGKST
jgi:DNA-binding NarL/FixJ family response regulator